MVTRREVLGSAPAAGAAFAVSSSLLFAEGSALAQEAPPPLAGHFHPKGKAPSTFTKDVLQHARTELPFSDTRDFDEQERGLIAPMTEMTIKADAGNVAWDMERFRFLDQTEDFDSIHPSLHRVSRLNNNYGLYEVVPGLYQVRGFDISNISFLRGKTGWIVIDPVVSTETARAAWRLFQDHLGEGLPVSAVIYSHTHGDHWGGVLGILDAADARTRNVEIVAPAGFMDFAVSENVYAGNAMNRRLFYQYGLLLPPAPHGFAGMAIGQHVSAGAVGLLAPTRSIGQPIEEAEVDGVRMVFQNTPNTEAPRTMNAYLPDMKALFMADMVMASMHNIYTLRGALVRDPLAWSKSMSETLYRFGIEADVLFTSHNWPRFGNERVQEILRNARDLYGNLNNQVLHLANQGVTINQIHNVYELPSGLQGKWDCRGYHGSATHNARAVVQRYLGFWDANPATLVPLSPADSAPLYVEMMGGSDRIIARGRELHDAGQYMLATEIVNKLVQAEPDNAAAKDLLADIFEQLGYQQENVGHRNSYLAAAYELRTGIPQGEAVDSSSPDVIRAMSTELFLNFLGIRMDSRKAEGLRFTINLATPDNGETFVIEMENATLTNVAGFQAPEADLTLTINRYDLEQTMIGAKTLEAQIADGSAKVEGDVTILQKLAATMVDFDPRFEIMPGTKGRTPPIAQAEAYQAVPEKIIAE